MTRDPFPDRNAFMLPPLDHVPVEPQPNDGWCLVCGIIVCAMIAAGGLGLYLGWPDHCDRRAHMCEAR